MVMWRLWKAHNDKLWKISVLNASRVMYKAKDLLYDWLKAQQQIIHCTINVNSEVVDVWDALLVGFIKRNMDAAYFQTEKIVSFGMCLSNENGKIFACRTNWRKAFIGIKEEEAIGLLEAITWLIRMSFTHVIFEIDAKGAVEIVNCREDDFSEFESVVNSCYSLLSLNSNSLVCFVRRYANVVAHKLARAARLYACPQTFDVIS
ncbi:hypothetical protein PTKIN_Ptkin01aG0131800 [Pterospermum kingtungense]